MLVTFETAERQTQLNVVANWAVPQLGHLLDWNVVGRLNHVPPGIYRVEAVTHMMDGGGTFGIHIQLVWVRERQPR